MSEEKKILVRVVGGDHCRTNGKGGFDTIPKGATIEATAREVAAFAGRLVPVNEVVPEVTKPARVPYRGIPADQVPPAGTSEVPPAVPPVAPVGVEGGAPAGVEGGDGGSQ